MEPQRQTGWILWGKKCNASRTFGRAGPAGKPFSILVLVEIFFFFFLPLIVLYQSLLHCLDLKTSITCFTLTVCHLTVEASRLTKKSEVSRSLQWWFEGPIMSCEVHLERQKKADLRARTSSAPVFAPRVPTVTLISHRELRDKHTAHRLQPRSLDSNLATSSHYRCSEGRSLSS